jgi:arylformamidase
MDEWIDVTVPIRQGMVSWPGNPGVRIESTEEPVKDAVCRVTKLSLGVHTGTHFDAPNHFGLPGGVETLPVAALIGIARVIAVPGAAVEPAHLEPHDVRVGERLIIKTKNSDRRWDTADFIPDYVFVTERAARYLVARQVRLVGVDYLSIGGPNDGVATHKILFEAGVCILEGLDLKRVGPGNFDLVALPLLIPNSDGAPARVLLRPRPATAESGPRTEAP